MSNKKRAQPLNYADFMRKLNSPWNKINSGLSQQVTSVYLPAPNISLPNIQTQLEARFEKEADAKGKSTRRASWDSFLTDEFISKTPSQGSNSSMGSFNGRPVTLGQWEAMDREVRGNLDNVMDNNESAEYYGGEAVEQRGGFGNHLIDALMSLTYGAANNKAENAKEKTDVFDYAKYRAYSMMEAMRGGRTSEQVGYDKAKQDIETTRAERDKYDPVYDTDYASLDRMVQNMEAAFASKYGGYHPAVQPDYSKVTETADRPEGEQWEYKNSKEGKRVAKAIQSTSFWNPFSDSNPNDKYGMDIIPALIPVNSKEFSSWWDGAKWWGDDKKRTTFSQIYAELGNEDAAAMGFLADVLFDVSTYATLGTGTVAKNSIKSGIVGLLGIERSASKLKKIKELDGLYDDAARLLDGETITSGKRSFTFGKGTRDEWSDFLGVGSKTGRQADKSKMAADEVRLVTEINEQLGAKIKMKYGDAVEEMVKLRKNIAKSNDPIVIKEATNKLAKTVTAMNLDKSVADALENVIRQTDALWKQVPQPKPKVWKGVKPEAVAEHATQRAVARSNFAKNMHNLHLSNATKALGRTAKKAASAVDSKAGTLFKALDGPGVKKALPIWLKKNPEYVKALENYTEYVAAHGNDGRAAITIEDVITSPDLWANKAIAPEIKNLLPYMNINKVTKSDEIVKMLRAEGLTESQAMRVASRYKAELADDIAKATAKSAKEGRLVDLGLDWSPVLNAQKNNKAIINEAIKEVKAAEAVMQKNISDFISAGALKMGETAGAKNALEVRFLGIPLVHFTTPEAISKAWNNFLKADNLISRGMEQSTRWVKEHFRGYSSLANELNRIRSEHINRGEQTIHSILGEMNRVWATTTKREHKQIFDLWASGHSPEMLEKYGKQLASLDETFADLSSYLEALTGKTLDELGENPAAISGVLNKYLPKGFDLDAETMSKLKSETLSVDWWKEYFTRVEVATKTRLAGGGTLNKSAPEVAWSMRVATEKAIARKELEQNIIETWGLKVPGPKATPAQQAHFDSLTKKAPGQRYEEMSSKFIKADGYVFPPQMREEIQKLIKLVDNHTTDEVYLNIGGRTVGMWKAMVTVYNVPEYTVRNALSDSVMMFLANVAPHNVTAGVQVLTHTGTYRHMLRDTPEFARAFTQADGAIANRHALSLSKTLADAAANPRLDKSVLSLKRAFRGENGEAISSFSAGEIYRLYYQMGLETNFVRTSVGAVAPRMGRTSKAIGDPIKEINSLSEDARRITLFIDSLERAQKAGIKNLDEALEYSAERVRKYLFDYTDFSNFERNVIGNAIPFYKWTRKAVPLIAEMIFFKPGKVALFPKMQTAANTIMGAPPPDGESYPWIPTADVVIPTWMRLNPFIYLGGAAQSGTYGRFPNPIMDVLGLVDKLAPVEQMVNPLDKQADIPDRLQSGVENIAQGVLSMTNPAYRGPFEIATGSQVFGANESGGRPISEETDIFDYLGGFFPQIRKADEIRQNGLPSNPLELANFLGALNVQQNTPNVQNSELIHLNKFAARNAEAMKAKSRGQ